MWDLYWKKWHWDFFLFSEYFGFLLPVSCQILLLSEGQAGEVCFGYRGAQDRKVLLHCFSSSEFKWRSRWSLSLKACVIGWLIIRMLCWILSELISGITVRRFVRWLYSRFEVTGFHYWRGSLMFSLLLEAWQPLEWGLRPFECEACWPALTIRPPNYIALRWLLITVSLSGEENIECNIRKYVDMGWFELACG